MKNTRKSKFTQCNLSNLVRYSGLLIKFVQMRYALVITLDWSSFWSFFIEFKSEKVRTSIPNRRKSHFFWREKWIYFKVWLKFFKNFASKDQINFLWHFNQLNNIIPQIVVYYILWKYWYSLFRNTFLLKKCWLSLKRSDCY